MRVDGCVSHIDPSPPTGNVGMLYIGLTNAPPNKQSYIYIYKCSPKKQQDILMPTNQGRIQ